MTSSKESCPTTIAERILVSTVVIAPSPGTISSKYFTLLYSLIIWKLISWSLLFHYRCICPPGFKVKTCAELEFCAIHSCPIGGQCHNFTSVCPAPLSTESTAPSSTRVSESMDPQRDSNKRWNYPSDPNKVELFSRSRTRPAFTSDSYDWILRIVVWSSAG